jgi:uncharacterized membrane-anchored protein
MINAAASFAQFFGRIPKAVLFGAAILIQLALLAAMVVDRAQILREGREVKLQTRPVDPRDFLRGDYVVLGYDISQLKAGALKDQPVRSRNVYVKLTPNRDGLYEAASVHAEPIAVTGPEVLIQGRVRYGASCGDRSRMPVYCENLQVRYNLESYFVPEGEGKKLEDARNVGKVTIVAAITPSGRAAIKRLLLDGQPVYEEPWF